MTTNILLRYIEKYGSSAILAHEVRISIIVEAPYCSPCLRPEAEGLASLRSKLGGFWVAVQDLPGPQEYGKQLRFGLCLEVLSHYVTHV